MYRYNKRKVVSMLMKDYTTELLNLEEVIITKVENISQQVHVYIELPRKEQICPCCGTPTDRVHDYRWQVVKDIPLGRDTFLHLHKRRYRCTCGKYLLAPLLQSHQPACRRDYYLLQKGDLGQRNR